MHVDDFERSDGRAVPPAPKGPTIPRGGTKKRHHRLTPNYKKILEAVLFLINAAERKGQYVTEYDIDKCVFIADIRHLKEYGRPVTFDNFVAMEHGPVPAATRDILGPKFNAKDWYDEQWPLWDRVPSPSDGAKTVKFIRPKRPENTRILSKTDISALSEALSVVKSLRFGGAQDYTHKHPAYIAAWNARGGKKANRIDYEKLLELPDLDLIEDLVYSSRHM